MHTAKNPRRASQHSSCFLYKFRFFKIFRKYNFQTIGKYDTSINLVFSLLCSKKKYSIIVVFSTKLENTLLFFAVNFPIGNSEKKL